MKNKVIVLDWGFYIHASGYASLAKSAMSVQYICLSMVIGDLKKVGISPNDIVIIAMDFHGKDYSSWRKKYESEYKGGRKKLPIEIYEKLNGLLEQLDRATKFHPIVINHGEADDVMAVCCRYYKDKEIILVVSDSDLEQMWVYPNVKIFSPHRKSKRYKLKPKNFNVYKLLASKIRKETSDNLTSPILNKAQYENRMKIVNLLELPEWVEQSIIAELESLENKEENLDLIPFENLRSRFETLYNQDKIVTYEKCVKYEARREKRKKNRRKK